MKFIVNVHGRKITAKLPCLSPETTLLESVGTNQQLKGQIMLKLQNLFNQIYRDSLIFVPGKCSFNKTFLCINFIQN